MKKIISVFLTSMIIISLLISLSAFGAVKIVYVDNDDSQGHTNARSGYNTYITGSSHYRNDARTQATGSTYNYYEWDLCDDKVTSRTGITLSLYAHINHSTFNDQGASYSALCSYSSFINVINQETFSPTWYIVGTVYLTPYTAVGERDVTLHGAFVQPGTSYGYTSAADGLRFNLTY